MKEERTASEKGTARRMQWIALLAGAVVLVIVILQAMRSSPQRAEVASTNDRRYSTPRFAVDRKPQSPPPLVLQNGPEKPGLAGAMPSEPKEGKSLVAKDAPRSYQEAVRRRQVRRLEERWQGEKEGRDWTHRVEQSFLEEFQKREIPGKVRQLDCRQTLCRLQIAFDSPNDAAKIHAIEHDADTGWYSDFRIEGEQVMVTAYLGAPGVDLRKITDDPPLR